MGAEVGLSVAALIKVLKQTGLDSEVKDAWAAAKQNIRTHDEELRNLGWMIAITRLVYDEMRRAGINAHLIAQLKEDADKAWEFAEKMKAHKAQYDNSELSWGGFQWGTGLLTPAIAKWSDHLEKMEVMPEMRPLVKKIIQAELDKLSAVVPAADGAAAAKPAPTETASAPAVATAAPAAFAPPTPYPYLPSAAVPALHYPGHQSAFPAFQNPYMVHWQPAAGHILVVRNLYSPLHRYGVPCRMGDADQDEVVDKDYKNVGEFVSHVIAKHGLSEALGKKNITVKLGDDQRLSHSAPMPREGKYEFDVIDTSKEQAVRSVLFQECDKDQDGKLSFPEFRTLSYMLGTPPAYHLKMFKLIAKPSHGVELSDIKLQEMKISADIVADCLQEFTLSAIEEIAQLGYERRKGFECTQGHAFERLVPSADATITCDACGEYIQEESGFCRFPHVWHCEDCDYDMCPNCAAKHPAVIPT